MISSEVESSLSAGRSETVRTCETGYSAISENNTRTPYDAVTLIIFFVERFFIFPSRPFIRRHQRTGPQYTFSTAFVFRINTILKINKIKKITIDNAAPYPYR